jgi:hypothetical protein
MIFLYRFALVVAFVVTQTGCTSAVIVRCREGERLSVYNSLYFGTAKPGGVVTAKDWDEFLTKTVTPRFPKGLTSSRASGHWRGSDGEIVREDSHVLMLVHPNDASSDKAVRELIDIYKAQFQQEAVLRITGYACVSF